MANLVDLNPYGVYNDLQGRPLNNGKVYIGLPNQDPKGYPAQVYWDAAMTIPAAQPLRTVGGYVARNGTPARVYINGNYSLQVTTSTDVQVFYVQDYYLSGTAQIVTSDKTNIVFDSIAALRSNFYPASVIKNCSVTSYYGGNAVVLQKPLFQGNYFIKTSDTTSPDNGGTIIVDAAGNRWYLSSNALIYGETFGCRADGVTDDSIAMQVAIGWVLNNRKKLHLTASSYLLNSVTVSSTIASAWPSLEIEGELGATGEALSQSGANGTTITTNGNSAFIINFDSFFNESIRFKNIGFLNTGAIGSTSAITVNKLATTGGSFPRGWEFRDLGCSGFYSFLTVQGFDPTFTNNFFGTIGLYNVVTYNTGVSIRAIDCYFDLLSMNDCLFHLASAYGISFEEGGLSYGSGAIMTLRNTHFEGCGSAAIRGGSRYSVLNLQSVSAEACGVTTGYGFILQQGINNLIINVEGGGYGDSQFALMPPEFRIGNGCIINSAVPVFASGIGWQTNTPNTVTPIISNNATYNQTDKYTFCMTPLSTNIGRTNNRTFERFSGYYSAGGVSLNAANSSNLPESVRANFVGVPSASQIVGNISDTFTAPSDGYIYTSWMAAYTASNTGFGNGAKVVINGVNVTPAYGNIFNQYTGNFLLLYSIGNGQQLGQFDPYMTPNPAWQTAHYQTFEPSLLPMSQAACGYPKVQTTSFSQLNGSPANDLVIVGTGDGVTPYTVRVKLLFASGAYGYREFLITGNGVSNARTVTTVSSNVVSGVATVVNAGANADQYNITVQNTSGFAMEVTKQVEYIS